MYIGRKTRLEVLELHAHRGLLDAPLVRNVGAALLLVKSEP